MTETRIIWPKEIFFRDRVTALVNLLRESPKDLKVHIERQGIGPALIDELTYLGYKDRIVTS